MNEWDIEELAYRAMGKSEDEADAAIDDDEMDVDDALYEKYGCDFETYQKIVEDLIKFTPIVESALTKTKFHAFVDVEKQRAILKLEV